MPEQSWIASAANLISAIGTPSFPAARAAPLRAVTPYSYTVGFGFQGPARPLALYDDFPAAKRKGISKNCT